MGGGTEHCHEGRRRRSARVRPNETPSPCDRPDDPSVYPPARISLFIETSINRGIANCETGFPLFASFRHSRIIVTEERRERRLSDHAFLFVAPFADTLMEKAVWDLSDVLSRSF